MLVFQTLFLGTWPFDGRRSLLTGLLNSHPLALKHLMPAMMTIYIGTFVFLSYIGVLWLRCFEEVEQTGASSQFYDKFSK